MLLSNYKSCQNSFNGKFDSFISVNHSQMTVTITVSMSSILTNKTSQIFFYSAHRNTDFYAEFAQRDKLVLSALSI